MIGPAMTSKESAEILRRHNGNVLDFPQSGSQTATYFFDTEDEAQSFLADVKEDLAEQEFFDFVDSNVQYTAGFGSWELRVDYIDRRPAPPEAA